LRGKRKKFSKIPGKGRKDRKRRGSESLSRGGEITGGKTSNVGADKATSGRTRTSRRKTAEGKKAKEVKILEE